MGTDVEKSGGMKEEATDFTDLVGGNGPWQRTVFIFFFFAALPSAWHNLTMSFFAPNVGHWCAKPTEYANLSMEQWKFQAIPRESSQEYNQCFRYKYLNSTFAEPNDSSGNQTETPIATASNISDIVGCQSWNYEESVYDNTVVSQWNLVCDKAWMVSMTKSVFMAGFLTSVLVLGQLSDKIGRKPVITASVIVLVVSGVICAFSISFIMFTVARFFIAFGAAGIFNTGFVMLMEIVSAESRSFYGIAVEFGWSTGYVLLPAIAWLVRDWFWLQLILTVPCIGLLAVWWLIPESPRWLLMQGQTERAQKILSSVAEKNKREVPDMEGALNKLYGKSPKEPLAQSGNMLNLVTTPGLWQKTLNIYLCWFVNAFIYYGLSFNTNDLAGDPFINFAISGAVEFPAYLISIFVIKSLGRRIPLMGTMVAGGVACLCTVPLTDEIMWIRTPLAMCGKFCITASFAIIYVYTAEIFPTVVRNTGIGTSSMCARIGSILAPFVRELGKATHPAVPLACYGLLSILSGLLILLLPETNGAKVPDTLEEAANFGRKKKKPCVVDAMEIQKPCAIHDNAEKVKPPSPVTKVKPICESKKLPDLLEEPSVLDEAMEDNSEVEEATPPTDVVNDCSIPPAQETTEEPEEVEMADVIEQQQQSINEEETPIASGPEENNSSAQQTPL